MSSFHFVVHFARVTMSTASLTDAQRASQFYKKKGKRITPDAETDNFSDNESGEDPLEKRQFFKETTGVITGHLDALKRKSQVFFKGSVTGSEVIIDEDTKAGKIRAGFALNGLDRLDDAAITKARNMDRHAESTLYNMPVMTRGINSLDQIQQQTVVSINVDRLLEAWFSSKLFIRFFILGTVSILVAGYLMTHVITSIRAYL